jgi:hypothetical protein
MILLIYIKSLPRLEKLWLKLRELSKKRLLMSRLDGLDLRDITVTLMEIESGFTLRLKRRTSKERTMTDKNSINLWCKKYIEYLNNENEPESLLDMFQDHDPGDEDPNAWVDKEKTTNE